MGQHVSNALVYPIVLMVLACAIVSFLLAYGGPQVVAVFESGHQELPIATRILIGMSDLIRHYWFYALIVLAAGTWGFLRWLKAPDARLAFERFLLRVPLAGKLVRGLNTARFPPTSSMRTASPGPGLADRGTAVVFATHEIAEAERRARRILVLADGELVFSGTPAMPKAAVTLDGQPAETDLEEAFLAFLQRQGH